jgi:hypothetical protein
MDETNKTKIIYRLVDFYAVEHFDDPANNPNPHTDIADFNGHCLNSIDEIDSSLAGGTAKDALDFLANQGGQLVKTHSKIHAVHGTYHAKNGHALGFVELPFSLDLPFNGYVAQGRPEEITILLELVK